jgi:DNA-binding NarL/FixJ family response regulator
MLDLVEAALRSGHPRQAAAHVAAIREAGVAAVSSRLALLAATAEALVASDADADQAYGEALALRDARRWPFDLARTHLLCGERLRRARRGRAAGGGGAPATTHLTTEARTHLVAAHDAFQRLGARAWADRAAMELRATGQVRQHGPAGAAEKWALTPQELEIALLAATGLTNKQIGSRLYLSHRTVGAHLYRVFPKLGITSRAALRDALSRHATAHVVG